MSNPKQDKRGDTLTSCHSFNSTEYHYNVGCTGYARDDVTMIAFTVDNPFNPESFNNRKTTRQLFMYKVGNGLLLQSRMYDTSGGTHGAQKESALYRDLVQRELSELESVPNLWKTYSYCNNKLCLIRAGQGFGGYQDWIYSDFDAKISVRHDHADNFEPFEVGTYGLCISCGNEINSRLYCGDCNTGENEVCADCGERCAETWRVHYNGEIIRVCENCLDEYYRNCCECGEYHLMDTMTFISDSHWVCRSCLDEYYTVCDECDEYCRDDEIDRAINSCGCEVDICESCSEAYYQWCECCNQLFHEDRMHTVYGRSGREISVCEDCLEENYTECENCGDYYPNDVIEDGLCPACRSEQ